MLYFIDWSDYDGMNNIILEGPDNFDVEKAWEEFRAQFQADFPYPDWNGGVPWGYDPQRWIGVYFTRDERADMEKAERKHEKAVLDWHNEVLQANIPGSSDYDPKESSDCDLFIASLLQQGFTKPEYKSCYIG